ncbi:hypothetical protein [Paenibacillus sp. FSL H7-689]|uniref:hypothetical protein n=1 Tax=Paenibacillus sp. FSL H7-689 TaxID=1227349 RepID=UPI0003E26AAD|nr:hypothetical protein [Paenibacillus sp. FSL H7-689]ETT46743.1 hypothetical protein C170_21894 [Paenibacillus sp. FSL H7-689]
MVLKNKRDNLLNFFVNTYIDIADLEEEKLRLQCEIIAVYTHLSLSKVLFKKNADLKTFQDGLFFGIVSPVFADYLYQSRTQVLARGVREIYRVDIYTLKTLQERLKAYLNRQKEKENNNSHTNDTTVKQHELSEDFVDYWTNIINTKGM